MQKKIFLVMFFTATVLFAAAGTPLNVKPGLWHVTGTNQYMGKAMKTDYNRCISAKDLDANPWVDEQDSCKWTLVTSTATDVEIKGTSCALGKEYGMDTNVDLKLHAVDSENVKAIMQGTSTGNGRTLNMNSNFSGKWMGATCSKE